MLHSSGTALTMTKRYDGNVPGWQMRRNDHHFVADIANDGRQGLFVYNSDDWYSEYLGTMTSSGTALTAAWRVDWVGEWNLGKADRFEVSAYNGQGRRGLIVHNTDWLGLIRATPTLVLDRLYHRFIHNYRHGRNW